MHVKLVFFQLLNVLYRANIDAKDNYLHSTPLHYASLSGRVEVVKYLVSKGANKNIKNEHGLSPYDLACKYSKKDEIKNILKWKWQWKWK